MKKILAPAFCLIFLLGCTPTTDTSTDSIDVVLDSNNDVVATTCVYMTSHGSCIEDGIDPALGGSWKLKGQAISTPAGSISSPFTGRTLTFLGTKNYTEDYSTETTDDQTMAGITSHCDVLGVLSGSWSADTYSDLNVDPPVTVNVLKILPNGGSPNVTCQATGEPISSNTASTPLGVGPSTGSSVEYTYNLNDDWTTLTITQQNPYANTTNVYTFTKL